MASLKRASPDENYSPLAPIFKLTKVEASRTIKAHWFTQFKWLSLDKENNGNKSSGLAEPSIDVHVFLALANDGKIVKEIK